MKIRIFTLSVVLMLLPLLSVAVQAASWKLDRVAVMIDEGKKVSLKVCGEMVGTLEWQSSDENVAVVNSKGVVRGRSHGDAVIKAVCTETGESAECLVSVGYDGQNPLLPPTWNLFIADGEPRVINGRLEIRRSSADGELLATVEVPHTDGQWQVVEVPVRTEASERDSFYVVATDVPASGVVEVDWLRFMK